MRESKNRTNNSALASRAREVLRVKVVEELKLYNQRAVKALEKAGFSIARQGKHMTMTNGERIITIPGGNPVNFFTLAW